MTIVKTERIHLSAKELEAFELVSTIALRCEESCESPILKTTALKVEEAIEAFWDYIVPDFTLGEK